LSLLDGLAIGRNAEMLVLRGSKNLRLNVRPQEQPAGRLKPSNPGASSAYPGGRCLASVAVAFTPGALG
jgi:hypothetical protein